MPDSNPAPRGPYAKGIQRREEILDRALEVFAVVGFKATSLRAVGEAIGVTHAALRHYFDSSEHLLLEVLRRADETALAVFEAEVVTGSADFGSRMATHSMQIPGLTALYQTMAARALETTDPGVRDFFVDRYRRVRGFAVLMLQAGQARGTVRADLDLDIAAALVIAASDGLSTQWLLDPDADLGNGLRLLEDLLRPPR